MDNIVIKELQIVIWTSTFSNSNGNIEELQPKILCEELRVDVPIGYFMLPFQMLTSKVWNVICNSFISICATR